MTTARADIVGNVWKIVAQEGDDVGPGDVICVLETMKMEIPVVTQAHGRVARLLVAEGQLVHEGDSVAEIEDSVVV